MHEGQHTIVIGQASFEDTAQNESLQHGFQRAVTHRARDQQHDTVTEPDVQIEGEYPAENNIATPGVERTQATLDHVDECARKRFLVNGIDAMNHDAVKIPAGLDHSFDLDERRC